jgi:uncharacterized protein
MMALSPTHLGRRRRPPGASPGGFRSWVAGLSAFLVLGAAASCSADRPDEGVQGRTAAGESVYPNLAVEEIRIPMRDGTHLGATLIRPETDDLLPAIVYRTPYGQESHFQNAQFPRKAAKRGYLVFLVDVRGRYTSEGEFRAYDQEREDGFDTVEWVAGQPRSDGRVGSYGGSYPGYVQWLALAESPEGYAAAAPAMTPTASHHFFYLGGAFNLTWHDWFVGAILPDLHRRRGTEMTPERERWAEERREWYMRRPLVDVPFLEGLAPYYFDWLLNPDLTPWWEFADVEKDFHRIQAPVLLVSGWYDNTYGTVGAIRGFRGMRAEGGSGAARRESRLILGPWNHTSLDVHRTRIGHLEFGPSAGIDYDDLLLRWFDAHLKGRASAIASLPPVQVFVMGENRWRWAEDWPIPGTEEVALYLGGGEVGGGQGGEEGRLTWEAPQAPNAWDGFRFDPRDPVWYEAPGNPGPFDQAPIEARDDVLVYTSEPLTEAMEVTGEVRAELFVSSSAPDTDFAVMLVDVHPDGTAYNLMGPEAGYVRMRYREGYGEQVLMEPDSVYRIVVGNMPTSNVFRPGHRIRVHVTSSRAPHFDPNPNTGEAIATAERLEPADQRLYRDGARPSRIVLPVIPAGGGF